MRALSRTILVLALYFTPGAGVTAVPLAAQAPAPRPTQQRPPSRPAQPRPTPPRAQPQPPATTQPVAKPVEPPPPPPPAAPQDIRFKTVYTNSGQRTDSVTYIKGTRERFEFQDLVLLKQHDQNRTIQISPAAGTYLILPDGQPSSPPAGPSTAAKPGAIVTMSTTIVDTGEKKTTFGRLARHVKTTMDRQPMPGACDPTKQRIEIDGWYIDAPGSLASQPRPDAASPVAAGCVDEIKAATTGDAATLGFPIAYTTTVTTDGSTPAVVSMEITEFETTTLDPALFEIPQGLKGAADVRELSKALSDAAETKLAAENAGPPEVVAPKTAGIVRIGVPEFTNKTTQTVDTRALRSRLIGELLGAKLDAQPMVAASQADVQKRAGELGYDYVLLAEVTELKVSKPGGLGGLMRAASGVAGGRGGVAGAAAGAAGAATSQQENTEATLTIKLVQPDGKQRLSTTAKGKDGSGFTLKTGLGLARFAGSMYLNVMTGRLMFTQLKTLGMGNFGGMGMLGDPGLFQMQTGGLGGAGRGIGIDATAGAASFLVQQALTMNSMGGLVGVPGQGPSFDASLGEALDSATKAVSKALQK